MSHPYKQYEENRHGRAVAKARGYDGGGVVRFQSRVPEDVQRLRSVQGVESGRIAKTSGDNVVVGPGRNPSTGGVKRSWTRRQLEDEGMTPYAKGGRVRLTGGADSGIGRMELAKRASKRRK